MLLKSLTLPEPGGVSESKDEYYLFIHKSQFSFFASGDGAAKSGGMAVIEDLPIVPRQDLLPKTCLAVVIFYFGIILITTLPAACP
jgi:hypothetical protein